jgi:molybdate transport system substrate-binding protein
MRAFISILAALLLAASASAQSLHVSAAASLREAMDEIAQAYQAASRTTVEVNTGASGQLLQQIRNGAPVDVFISASDAEVAALIADGLAVPSTRVLLAGNELALITPADNPAAIHGFADLPSPSLKRLAIGQPRVVPAGVYAEQTLKTLKLTDALAARFVYGASVRQVLDYVQRGEVDAGIVYHTDAVRAGAKVILIELAQPQWHAPIHYIGVALSRDNHDSAPAIAFLRFAASDPAVAVFARHGFIVARPATRRAAP